jgi:hypothetical protein
MSGFGGSYSAAKRYRSATAAKAWAATANRKQMLTIAKKVVDDRLTLKMFRQEDE